MAQFSLDDVKLQIKKACQIYRKYPTPKPKQPHSCLASSIISTANENYNSPLSPTPKEIDMADTVQFVWLNWVTPTERRILWQKYDGVPWKILAYDEGMTIRRARYKAQKALEKILSILIKESKNQ